MSPDPLRHRMTPTPPPKTGEGNSAAFEVDAFVDRQAGRVVALHRVPSLRFLPTGLPVSKA